MCAVNWLSNKSVAKWTTSTLFFITWTLGTFCRRSYAFAPIFPLRVDSLRSEGVVIFATKTRTEEDITASSLTLLNNEVWDAFYQELVDFSKEYGHLHVLNEASVAQIHYRRLVNFCQICRGHYLIRFRKSTSSAKTFTKNVLNITRIELLDELGFDWSALNAKWEMRFQQAETYTREHGHCNVPDRWIENPELGIWICNQRTLYRQRLRNGWDVNGAFSPSTTDEIWKVREKRLESIGIDWFPQANCWMRKWERLCDFWKEYGHHEVPEWADPELFKWTSALREQCREYQKQLGDLKDKRWVEVKGLSDDRIKALKAIQFWDEPSKHNASVSPVSERPFTRQPPLKKGVSRKRSILYDDTEWTSCFEELVVFLNKHGHMCVPIESSVSKSKYRRLHYFCRMCRRHYQYFIGVESSTKRNLILTEDRIQRLNDIGFDWQVYNGNWKMRFEQLEEYYREYGNCNVPIQWCDNPQLGEWVSDQRVEKRRSDKLLRTVGGPPLDLKSSVPQEKWEQRVQKLDSLGFNWDPLETVWWGKWEQLRVFKKEHGHIKVSRSTNPQLARWAFQQLRNCRKYKNAISSGRDPQFIGLNDDRIKALKEIEVWDQI
jgi:hypothetical protein